MSTLTPMEQLLAFCDWEREHYPPPDGHKHIAEWAAEEIERLQAAQFAGKVRKAVDRIERDAAEIERLRAENETLRAFARDRREDRLE